MEYEHSSKEFVTQQGEIKPPRLKGKFYAFTLKLAN